MIGIEPGLYNRLQETLLNSGFFENDRNIKAIFVDKRIVPWANQVPHEPNAQARVQAVIKFLFLQRSVDGENGLVLLLLVLSEQKDQDDQLHHELVRLANELKSDLQIEKQLPTHIDNGNHPFTCFKILMFSCGVITIFVLIVIAFIVNITIKSSATNIIVTLSLIILALLFWFTYKHGLIQNKVLKELNKIAGIFSFLTALIFFIMQPIPIIERFDYNIQVLERGTNNPIVNTEIFIEFTDKPNLEGITDINGLMAFSIPMEYSSEQGRLIIEADGYQRHLEEIYLNKKLLPKMVRLELVDIGSIDTVESTPIVTLERTNISATPQSKSSIGVLIDKAPAPLDVMVVIDNSCSMFPARTLKCSGTSQYGSDPDFLRISGASSFIARLGFAEQNELEYRLGTISMGEAPLLNSELKALSKNRDFLIDSISSPNPALETQIVPALNMAYRLLRKDFSKPSNRKAIVLITDGFPYPLAGQSESDIEGIISENSDILVFIMLLQSPLNVSSEFQNYIKFWERIGARYTHVFTYRIGSNDQIIKIYNEIAGQLQNTMSSLESYVITSNDKSMPIIVGKYAKKITLTIIRDSNNLTGKTIIFDSNNVPILDNDIGVQHLRSKDDSIEVIAISSPRLRDDLKEKPWLIISDTPAELLLDRKGQYHINIITPSYSLTDLTNVYLATQRHDANTELLIQFNSTCK